MCDILCRLDGMDGTKSHATKSEPMSFSIAEHASVQANIQHHDLDIFNHAQQSPGLTCTLHVVVE